MPCADIARRLGNASERAVRYRLDRLVKEGIIKITAITNHDLLGFSVVADVFIKVEPGLVMDVAKKLSGFECVNYVACSTGDHDISIQILAQSNLEVYTFVTDVVGKIPGVRRTSTSILPVILKRTFEWHMKKIENQSEPSE